MAAAFLPADDLHLRRVSARHGYSEVSRGVVGLSLSEIEDIDYLTERPSSRSSLVRFGFLKPPNVVEPINSRAPSMELPNNAAKTVGSLHKVGLVACVRTVLCVTVRYKKLGKFFWLLN